MKIDSQQLQRIEFAQPAVSAVKPSQEEKSVKAKVAAAAEAAKDKPKDEEHVESPLVVDSEKARQVTEKLNRQFSDHNVKFHVRDPNKVGANNIVIEIYKGDKVIATIPPDEALRLSKESVDLIRGKDISPSLPNLIHEVG